MNYSFYLKKPQKPDIEIFVISVKIPLSIRFKSKPFWPLVDVSPVLTDPERARRMEKRRLLLEAQAEQLRVGAWN